MNTIKLFLTLLSAVAIISCNSRQEKTSQKKLQWFKGNLHTHSYWSDGDEYPEEIMHWYKSNGYQFIALSDHNILAEGEKWIEISKDSLRQQAFRNYLDKYGKDWVDYKLDSGRITVKLKTYQEYRTLFEEDGKFLIIQSEEISDEFEGKPLHLVGTNLETLIEPQGGNSVVEVLQNIIDAVIEQRQETGKSMIPHINHPNYKYAISVNDLIAINGNRFFEVYNGHPMVRNLGDSLHMSTEEMWDIINISYLKKGKPLMYGLATDDSHQYHRLGSKWSNAGRGWIMVETDNLSAESLIKAMEKGDFYSSTGVVLENLNFENNTLTVDVMQEKGVSYILSFIGVKKGQNEPEELASFHSNKGSFKLSENIQYVRCKIVSSKLHNNPIEDLLYEMAWIQPVLHVK